MESMLGLMRIQDEKMDKLFLKVLDKFRDTYNLADSDFIYLQSPDEEGRVITFKELYTMISDKPEEEISRMNYSMTAYIPKRKSPK